MLTRSHSDRRPLPGLSGLLTPSTPRRRDEEISSPSPPPSFSAGDSIFMPATPISPPFWVTQALSNLEQGERELLVLREQQQAEIEEVNRELDRACIEAEREERRLLEKIELDHREAQRCLDRVKRENSAAVRVVQSLLDHHLRKMGQLKVQVQRWGTSSGGASNKNQLQMGVADITQPWEISLSLKRVGFLPSAEAKVLSLGAVDIQEQSMVYPIGVCGVQGQKCALHSGEPAFANITPLEIRKDPPSPTAAKQSSSFDEARRNSGGGGSGMRVVRKLRLSVSSVSGESEEEHPRRVSVSSQDEEVESQCSDTAGQDLLFLAFPPVSSQGESEGEEPDGRQDGTKKRSVLKGQRKAAAAGLVPVPSEEPSYPPEGSLDMGTSKHSRGSFTSHSLMDLSSGHSKQGRGLASKSPRGSSAGDGSPPSPVDSEDSCYAPRNNGSLKEEHKRSKSAMSMSDLPSKLPLLNDNKGLRRTNRSATSLAQSVVGAKFGRSPPDEGESRFQQGPAGKRAAAGSPSSNRVSRSLSMSSIDSAASALHRAREQQSDKRKRDWVAPVLREMEEEGVAGSSALESAYLVKQMGKQGSGRNDFNLPSGVHAAAKGQLFIVDCGNARIQITDTGKNLVQQVSPSSCAEKSARICNYFDVAVSAAGLIAMTCAAERALLVFSRHGRLLQTFGGTAIGSTNEELDAPRGVTVNYLDEFLVADIKRGTLTALRLCPKTGARLERTVVTGFHRPYLVAACLATGVMALSERGNETGRAPCIRVLEPEGWSTVRILGVCSGMGPVLTCPWGLCIDSEGDVLVADWGKKAHRVLLYPALGVGWPVVSEDLSSPRGLALLPDGQLVVSDSMNHCIKIYQYK